MKLSIPDHILSIKPYTPGKPLEELEREYGIDDSIKLASNENPIGPSPMAVAAVKKSTMKLNRYPDGSGHDLIRKISDHIGFSPQHIVLGNGSDEIIGMLAFAMLQPGDEVILPVPSFLMYEIMVRGAGATPVCVPLTSLSIDLERIKKKITSKTRMIFLCNPNNPTGTVISKKDFEKFIQKMPSGVIVVLDEAYIEFVRDRHCVKSFEYLDDITPLVALRTFSKAYGLAGLRIGYGVMPVQIADILNRIRLPFNTNLLAQAGAGAALEDKIFLEKVISLVHEGLDFLYDVLDGLGIDYFPTQTNFFLIDVRKDADEIYEDMLRQGVIVRSMKSYGYPNYIRINVGLHEENVRFLKALEKSLA
ncbi:MAG: histidinol-phosphate transaminase [Deltaproteobacteria bacterium]|nr:histidinol-phosphate transaminase [Deltaproteobacteria bacterium]